jgi:hypothetical protein
LASICFLLTAKAAEPENSESASAVEATITNLNMAHSLVLKTI